MMQGSGYKEGKLFLLLHVQKRKAHKRELTVSLVTA